MRVIEQDVAVMKSRQGDITEDLRVFRPMVADHGVMRAAIERIEQEMRDVKAVAEANRREKRAQLVAWAAVAVAMLGVFLSTLASAGVL